MKKRSLAATAVLFSTCFLFELQAVPKPPKTAQVKELGIPLLLQKAGDARAFKKSARSSRALSATQINALAAALSSTSSSAGTTALILLGSLAAEQTTLMNGIFNICLALTSPASSYANATPISLATAAVRKALSTGIIASVNADYNFTLLHYASLFASFGTTIDASVDVRAKAATIVSTLFSRLTSAEQLAALSAADMWGSTPLHYALLSSDSAQLALINALLADATIKNSALSIANTSRYTPLHFAGVFVTSAKNTIKALFMNLTAAQKTTAFTTQDQWGNTPMHYAALYKNTAILDKTFLANLSLTQRTSIVEVLNNWDQTAAHFATFDVTKTALLDGLLHPLSDTQKLALTYAVPSPYFDVQTIVVPNLLLAQ